MSVRMSVAPVVERTRALQTSAVTKIARDPALVRRQSHRRRLGAGAGRIVFMAECWIFSDV
jgi:hypothetical protein